MLKYLVYYLCFNKNLKTHHTLELNINKKIFNSLMTSNLLLNIQWQDSDFYEAGERQILIEWEQSSIPLVGHQYTFNETKFEVDQQKECFIYKGEKYTIFKWIEQFHGWHIKAVTWVDYKNKKIPSLVLVDQFEH